MSNSTGTFSDISHVLGLDQQAAGRKQVKFVVGAVLVLWYCDSVQDRRGTAGRPHRDGDSDRSLATDLPGTSGCRGIRDYENRGG